MISSFQRSPGRRGQNLLPHSPDASTRHITLSIRRVNALAPRVIVVAFIGATALFVTSHLPAQVRANPFTRRAHFRQSIHEYTESLLEYEILIMVRRGINAANGKIDQ